MDPTQCLVGHQSQRERYLIGGLDRPFHDYLLASLQKESGGPVRAVIPMWASFCSRRLCGDFLS